MYNFILCYKSKAIPCTACGQKFILHRVAAATATFYFAKSR